jgi:tRNA(fMet)-specific endonuclease VapC
LLLLETNHCFRIVAREPAFLARLQSLSTEHVVTSVIVAGELRYGASISQRKDENLSSVEQFLDAIALIPITSRIAVRYGALKGALLEKFGPRERASRRGFDLATLGFSDNDLWIAASALQRGATLVSADSDFQRMAAVANLNVDDWTP